MSREAYISDPSYVPEVPQFSLRTLLICFLVASIFLALFAYIRNQYLKHEADVAQRKETILLALATAVNDVEAIRAKLGRAPTDTHELEQILGRPFPETPAYELYYKQTGDNAFYLLYPIEWIEGFSGDYLIYDSNKPAAGWAVGYN